MTSCPCVRLCRSVCARLCVRPNTNKLTTNNWTLQQLAFSFSLVFSSSVHQLLLTFLQIQYKSAFHMKPLTGRSVLRLILVSGVIGVVLAVIVIPSGVRSPHAGPGNRILNRLREIDRAKEHWRAGHPDTLTEQDLAPYLSQDFWNQTVAGERYLIHSLEEPPEAVMTKYVDWIPKRVKVRFSPEPNGKVEVWPNAYQTQWSGRRSSISVCISMPLARRHSPRLLDRSRRM